MSRTNDRISYEQRGQAILPLSDASFVDGVLHVGEHVCCIAGTLVNDEDYVLKLPSASELEGRMCSFMIQCEAAATLTIKSDGQTVLEADALNPLYVVLWCDGRTGHVIFDRNKNAEIEARIPVPVGGTTGQVLAKASADDGDLGWETPALEIPAGGTIGQVLAKKSATDYDLEWITLP